MHDNRCNTNVYLFFRKTLSLFFFLLFPTVIKQKNASADTDNYKKMPHIMFSRREIYQSTASSNVTWFTLKPGMTLWSCEIKLSWLQWTATPCAKTHARQNHILPQPIHTHTHTHFCSAWVYGEWLTGEGVVSLRNELNAHGFTITWCTHTHTHTHTHTLSLWFK